MIAYVARLPATIGVATGAITTIEICMSACVIAITPSVASSFAGFASNSDPAVIVAFACTVRADSVSITTCSVAVAAGVSAPAMVQTPSPASYVPPLSSLTYARPCGSSTITCTPDVAVLP